METQYRITKLSDILTLIGGGTPRTTNPDYWNGQIPWLSVADFNHGYRYVHFSEKTITPKAIEESSTSLLKKGQLIISARGTVGVIAQLGQDMAFNQSCYGITAKDDLTTNDFLYYLLNYEVRRLKQMTHGAVFDTITRDTFDQISVDLPPLPTQQAIARILGSLDDKIELNRQMNETLEAIARVIFQSWFVDFDPVRAKAEGRDTGLPPEIAALFPEGFEEVEGREVPSGWRVGPLSSIIELLGGGTPKTTVEKYWNGDIPWFSVVDASSDSDMFVIDTKKHITRAGVENSSTNIFPVGTTIITARGTVGKLALVGVPMAMNQSCYGVKGAHGYPNYYIHFLLKKAINELQQHTHGTVFETITRQTFDGVEIVVPPAHTTQKFDAIIQSNLEKIRNNLMESRTLAQIRDPLLPKLMSGEIEVEGIET